MKKEKKYEKVNFSKAMADIKEMLLATHDIKQTKSYFNYKGEDITHYSVLATNSTIKEDVSKKGASYHKERDRELLDVILMKIFQLGYSQAKIEEDNDEIKQFLMSVGIAQTEKLKNKLKEKND